MVWKGKDGKGTTVSREFFSQESLLCSSGYECQLFLFQVQIMDLTVDNLLLFGFLNFCSSISY